MPSIDPKRLQVALNATGIPVAELARRVGVTTSYMARIVNGDRRLKRNPALRRQIANALGVYPDWIEARDQEIAA